MLNSWAQTETTAAITGAVQTEKGNPVTGVAVAALHLPTGIRRVTTTDAQGHIDLNTLLSGGPYVLQITQPGFRSQVINNVFLKPGQSTSLAIVLVPDAVAVGTRRADRSAQDAAAPVDVIDMRSLALTGPRNGNTLLLKYIVPSFNSNRETSADGADHVDGFNLRGLGVDQVLVLVNGHRRHSSALVNLLGSLQTPPLFQKLQNDGIVGNNFIAQRELSLLTMGSPTSKLIGTLGYDGNKLGGQVRVTRYGQVSFYNFNFDGLEEGAYYLVFKPRTSTDVQLTYRVTKGLLLAGGPRNVFNVRPDNLNAAADNGHAPDGVPAPHNQSRAATNAYLSAQHGQNISLPYDHDILPYQMAQMGASGAFFYLKASYSFGL